LGHDVGATRGWEVMDLQNFKDERRSIEDRDVD